MTCDKKCDINLYILVFGLTDVSNTSAGVYK